MSQQALERLHLNLRMQHRILKTAKTLFVRKGFAGVSLGDVAKKLQINPSLIYHYFASKEELWNAVRSPFLEIYRQEFLETIPLPTTGLRSFLEGYLSSLLNFWLQQGTAARILCWSGLEEKSPEVNVPDPLGLALDHLKKQGAINKAITTPVAAALLRSAAKGPVFYSSQISLRTADARRAYLQLIVDGLERLLSP